MSGIGVEIVDNIASKDQHKNGICTGKPWRKLGSK